MASINLIASALVPIAPEQLWQLVCDTSRFSEWVAGTESVTRTDGPARLGSTYAEINPILGPWKAKTSWTVIEFDEPSRQVHRTTDIPLASEFLVITEIEPAQGKSRVTLTLRASSSHGPLGAAFFTTMKLQTRRDNQCSLENLAKLATRELAAGNRDRT